MSRIPVALGEKRRSPGPDVLMLLNGRRQPVLLHLTEMVKFQRDLKGAAEKSGSERAVGKWGGPRGANNRGHSQVGFSEKIGVYTVSIG